MDKFDLLEILCYTIYESRLCLLRQCAGFSFCAIFEAMWSKKASNTNKIDILVDAGNFYHLVLKKLGVREANFDFEKFVAFLANGRTIADKGKRFYVGTVREQEGNLKSKEAMARQTSLFTLLTKQNWEIKTSKLKIRNEEIMIDDRVEDYQKIKKLGIHKIKIQRFREKGIDVKLATDLIVGAIDNQYDTAIIISSDSDLIPAIDWVRHRTKKKIEYIGFSIPDENSPSNSTNPLSSLINKSDVKRVLVKSDLRPFITMEFGKEDGVEYEDRPSAYGIILKDSKIALAKVNGNLFLPGGGIAGGELPEKTVSREALEELGLDVKVIKEICRANDYFYSKNTNSYIKKTGTFFLAEVIEAVGQPTEKDHFLTWEAPKNVIGKMYHKGHSWAIEQTTDGI